jgi:hypothetical protein
MRFARA